jgi:large subunit ribosomal protein L15
MLNKLPKIIGKRKKRVGIGWGSGKGKYAGRGNKGQKSRESSKSFFEGGQVKLSVSIPMIRGKLRNKSRASEVLAVNLSDLEKHPLVKNGFEVTEENLVKIGLLNHTKVKRCEVKLLAGGALTKKLNVQIKASKTAIEKVISLGGEYKS